MGGRPLCISFVINYLMKNAYARGGVGGFTCAVCEWPLKIGTKHKASSPLDV